MLEILYTGFITLIIMLLLHHLYNYLQTNLTVPKVTEPIHPTILQDLQEIQEKVTETKETETQKDELKEYLNQFKKK
jgi:hypothetical protein